MTKLRPAAKKNLRGANPIVAKKDLSAFKMDPDNSMPHASRETRSVKKNDLGFAK